MNGPAAQWGAPAIQITAVFSRDKDKGVDSRDTCREQAPFLFSGHLFTPYPNTQISMTDKGDMENGHEIFKKQ
ncbi:MAG: hypothetical protein SWH68_08080 [Thermodesulfobacteriota bacterium]|nr:hypothetical protein [Thermodesulfobacteriota bacterium]